MSPLIIKAIRLQRLIAFVYNGLPRIVEPHVLGDFKGQLDLFAYQVGGASQSGAPIPKWRRFSVAKMTNLKVLPDTFPGPRHERGYDDVPFDRIHTSVANPEN